jgi:hypothetical protein
LWEGGSGSGCASIEKLDRDPRHSEKLDPDPNQSQKKKGITAERTYGTLELWRLNLEPFRVGIRIKEKARIWIRIPISITIKLKV